MRQPQHNSADQCRSICEPLCISVIKNYRDPRATAEDKAGAALLIFKKIRKLTAVKRKEIIFLHHFYIPKSTDIQVGTCNKKTDAPSDSIKFFLVKQHH